jgi:hypothetical protein
MSAEDFYGAWKLISIETRNDKGELVRQGVRTGIIIYSTDGYMSVVIMKDGRPLFKSGDIRGGSVEEKISAVDGYISYTGRFTVKKNRVFHHIEASLFPNWIGEDQERFYELDGNRLTLSTPLMLVGGRELSTHLIWEKVKST